MNKKTRNIVISALLVLLTAGICLFYLIYSERRGEKYWIYENIPDLLWQEESDTLVTRELMRVADIYGFTPSSSQTTNVSENDEGNEEVTSSGAISVALNLKPQTTPSPAYTTLNRVQNYVFYDLSTSTPRRTDYPVGDARY